MSKGTNAELSFEGLIPHTAVDANAFYYDGYEGFDFSDVELLTRHGIRHFDLLNTGFSNVLRGDCEAYTIGNGGGTSTYGSIESAGAKETFELKSGIFASGYRTFTPIPTFFVAISGDGRPSGEVRVELTQTADKIDFANYGGLFHNIAELEIKSYSPYDVHGFYPIAMDNIKIHWNGAVPHSGGRQIALSDLHSLPPHLHVAPARTLPSALGHTDPGGGLTGQFSLPHCDWFGT